MQFSNIILFYLHNAVTTSLMLPWLPLGTTFSIRRVSVSLKRIAARKVKCSILLQAKEITGDLVLEPDLPTADL